MRSRELYENGFGIIRVGIYTRKPSMIGYARRFLEKLPSLLSDYAKVEILEHYDILSVVKVRGKRFKKGVAASYFVSDIKPGLLEHLKDVLSELQEKKWFYDYMIILEENLKTEY